ncbi:MAG: efflux RND transporter periplasmic adaptor subunit [Bryobacterales bacterium]|nr:efflux RND transporter periplasmic adaptor subunit [Bryobacterales bacterium]
MRRKIIIPILLAAALGAAAWRYFFHNGADPNRMLLHGNIELTETDLSFKVPGRLVELLVDEGANVTKGGILARLDRTELERSRDREVASKIIAASALVQLRTGIDYQSETIAGDMDLKRADLRQADARLAELLNGSRPEEIQQAWAGWQEAKAQHDVAQRDWERAQRLYKSEDISTAQHDQFRMKAEATAMTLKRAQETLTLAQAGPRKEQIEAARAQVDRAKAALRLSEVNKLDLKRRREEVPAREADIVRSEAQLAVYDTQLRDRTLIAPTDGVILTKSAELGEVLAAGAAVVTLGDIDKPWVRAYVAESELGRVKLGMPVEVRTDSFKNKTYKGRVTFIASEAEFTPKTIQTQEERVKLVYRIKIEVENPHRELKLNMPVDAEIQLQ